MTVFLDTSSLVKLYHDEAGTSLLDTFFKQETIEQVLLSEITKIELESAFWKKARTKEITIEETIKVIGFFRADYDNYSFVDVDQAITKAAKVLLQKYWEVGLRTLDAIQLASVLKVRSQIEIAFTADQKPAHILDQEQIRTQ